MHQHAILEDTVYFWFGSNDTSGSGDDGATPLCDVRLAGATISDAPILSPTPELISNAAYPAGCYEVAVAATAVNGFAATNTYAVFCTITADSQNPTGFVGSFTLDPIRANILEISDDATAAVNAESFFDGTGYAGTNNVIPTVTTTGTATAVTNISTDGIDALSFSAGAIDATAIATDAIDADALKADAVTEIVTGVLTTQMTEAYAADTVAPTLAQILFQIWSMASEKAVSSTTVTTKKLDGSTTSMTFTLSDATDPVSITRAT